MEIGNPQSFNRYSYVGNDPINFVDPSGLFELVTQEQPDLSALISLILGGLVDNPISPIDVGGPVDPGGGGGVVSGTSSTTSEESRLSECAKKLLQKFFPKLNLDAINVTFGLPAGGPSQTTSGQPIARMVVGNTIYATSQSEFENRYGATWAALEFLAHEITHVDQFRRLGTVGFGIGYAIEGVFQALITPASRAGAASYNVNAFETRADRNAARIIRELRREGSTPCPVEGGVMVNVTVKA